MPSTQDHRHIGVSCAAFPNDTLLLTGFAGGEQLSGLFTFNLEIISKQTSIDPAKILKQSMTVRLDLPGGGVRYFNGHVCRFSHQGFIGIRDDQGQTTDMAVYHATLRPWLWFLTRTSDCRIFQKKTAVEIIEEVLKEQGLTDYELHLGQISYPPREYCVQYRETDFNFLSRLMEDEGIYYYFKHVDGRHVLVLANSVSSHHSFPDYGDVPFVPAGDEHQSERDHVSSWATSQEIRSSGYALTDFDFANPKNDLLTKRNRAQDDHMELFDYPGGHSTHDEGDHYVRLRHEEQQAQYEVAAGSGNARGLAAGCLFTLAGHPRSDQNREYLLVSTSYHATAAPYATGGDGDGMFAGSFTVIPSATPYRPLRRTPEPFVQGPQTAIVVGPKGDEISTESGQVKVQFHWDRRGQRDQNSSCWIRVAQSWAGNGWGASFIPRIGHEVVVEFLEGDPDRPIITGSLYNGVNKIPYAKPEHPTRSTIKSNSSMGGGGSNEIYFDDKKGDEEVYMHAEKNFHRIVKHNDKQYVGNDQVIEIQQNRTETVKEGDEKITVAQGDRTVTVDQGDDTHRIKQGNRVVKIDMGDDNLTIAMGDQVTKVSMGKSSTEALQSIELKVGGNSIKIDQTGITIKGMMIKLEGSAMTEVKAPMTTVAGDGMLKMTGGLTMINS